MPNNIQEDPAMANARQMATRGRSNVLAEWQAEGANRGQADAPQQAWGAMGRRLGGSVRTPDRSGTYSIHDVPTADR